MQQWSEGNSVRTDTVRTGTAYIETTPTADDVTEHKAVGGYVWRKSSASGIGDCVEVAAGDGLVMVRDSKQPGAAVLRFSDSEWTAFLCGVAAGEFTRSALRAAR